MGANTHIEWCDHTFNPWEGCTKVSPGCANCYAETRNARFGGGTAPNWGKGALRRRTSASNWAQPAKWDRARGELEAEAAMRGATCLIGPRPRVFCASLADWLDDEVPIEWLADLLTLIHSTQNLDWLLLTKRPQNWKKRLLDVLSLEDRWGDGDDITAAGWMIDSWQADEPPANVWIGTTVEDQIRADERIPALLSIPARVRFLSCEPLLGEVDISFGLPPEDPRMGRDVVAAGENIKWVIVGGESGPNARPMHPDWARSLRDQCAAAGVPFLFKQWGEWAPGDPLRDGAPFYRAGKKTAGRSLDSVEHNGFPEGAR